MDTSFHGEEWIYDASYCGGPPRRVMSTFSGIGAASISWKPDAFVLIDDKKIPQFEFVAYAEIEPFPCHVLHYRRGTSRPKYMPDPLEQGITQEEEKARKARIADVSQLPTTGIVNFGDITQITDDDLRALGCIDILEGGSPCQAFSVAGERHGLNDPRGNLLLAFCRLAERMREINGLQYVVWENVHGVLSDETNGFGCLLASLAGEQEGPLQPPGRRWTNAGRVSGPDCRQVAWRTIQASHWGVPQRRKRIFVVASLRAGGVEFGTADDVLFESEGSGWHPNQSRKTRQVVVSTYRSGDRLAYRSATERYRDPDVLARLDAEASIDWLKPARTIGTAPYAIDMKSQPYASHTAYALTAKNEGNPPAVVYALADDYSPKASKDSAFALMAGSRSGGGRKQMVVHPRTAGAPCASGAGTARTAGMASETDFVVITKPVLRETVIQPLPSVTRDIALSTKTGKAHNQDAQPITNEEGDQNPENWVVRRFTPLECERLQGFPDHWTDVPFKGKLATDGHRYKAIGNSMACPVMSFIGDSLETMICVQEAWEVAPDWVKHPKRKRGRPLLNGSCSMSAAERQRNRRARLRQLNGDA
ncbi:DNA cytosine methyltransferase [Tardiphaga robiniae]|uniref:DNA (cytosine-5-)-methyltransferase n=1 Tax=Tardiphaga robiniae TaxID=943830 RepID=A0A7G6TUF7_9BRAD|nr:DNA cytosine methyltransferase [Tardiphaga robiniae]QND70389.1 DNA cytosine methyltransferase [Tardiphaga robiniae]